ncbi:MAG: transglutaminase domain-containing protein [Oceanicaulis sp.]|nr:transglutaminase domain-containing protein [Oceanicaulis sp.]
MAHSNKTRAKRHEYFEGGLGAFMKHAIGILFAVCALGASWAQAEAQPALNFDTGELVSPEAANSYYGPSALSDSGAAAAIVDERVLGLSRALRGEASRIDAYIRDQIALAPGFGLQRGAAGVVLDREGTAFDVADLFVQLVRAEGGQARYVYGTVALPVATVRDVYQIRHSVDVAEFFAASGIPASVGGSVRFSHVWVEVRDQLGVWRTYDPALKRHLWADGAGAQPSLVSGGATGFVNRARQGMQSGTLNGRAWVTSLNVASVQSDLVAAASTLDGWIASDAQRANASSMELWGGYTFGNEPVIAPATTSHPYAAVIHRWTGGVPNVLRSKLTISVGPINQQLFVDQIYSTRLTIKWRSLDGYNCDTTNQGTCEQDPTRFELGLYSGHTSLAQLDERVFSDWLDYQLVAFETPLTESVTLALDLPLAAFSGALGDLTYETHAYPGSQSDIILAFSDLTQRHVATYEAGRRSNRYQSVYDSQREHYYVYDIGCGQYDSGPCIEVTPDPEQEYWQHPSEQGAELELERDSYWREWLAARHSVSTILGSYSDTQIFSRATLGVTTGGDRLSELEDETRSGTSVAQSTDNIWLDAISDIGLIGASSLDERSETARIYSAFSTSMEAAVVSAAINRARFGGGYSQARVRHGASVIESYMRVGQKVYWIEAGQTGSDTFLQTLGYSGAIQSAIGEYLSNGFDVLVPETNSDFSRWGEGVHVLRDQGGLQTAFVVADPIAGRFRKGGGIPSPGVISPPEFPSPDYNEVVAQHPGLRAYGVSLRHGDLSYSPGPDLVSGPGEFPYGLSLQRIYSGSAGSGSMGYGWSHNWDMTASMQSSLSNGVSLLDPRASAGAWAAMELMSAAISLSNPAESAALQAVIIDAWVDEFAIQNVITLSVGNGTVMFREGPDGSYRADRGSRATLTRTPASGYAGLGSTLTYTAENGEQIVFEALDPSQFTGYDSEKWTYGLWHARSWTFPYGVSINLHYRDKTGTLERVANSLGWYLDFASEDNVCAFSGPDAWQPFYPPPGQNSSAFQEQLEDECAYIGSQFRLINSVTSGHLYSTQSTQTATYVYDGVSYDVNHPTPTRLVEVQTPATGSGRLRYDYEIVEFGGTVNHESNPVLSAVYTPRSSTQPDMRVTYDRSPGYLPDRVRTLSLLQEGGYVDRHYYTTGDSGVFVNANGEEVDTTYRPEGWLWWTRDPENRFTINDYNAAGLVRRTRQYYGVLELVDTDWSDGLHWSWVEYDYDQLSNRIRQTVLPRSGSINDALITEYEYSDSNWPRLRTHVRDPRGGVSRTYYHPTTGLVTRETGPSGEDVSYQYSPLGQVTNAETVVEP